MIDSLKIILVHTTVDTVSIRLYNTVAWQYRYINPDSGILFAEKAIDMCEKIISGNDGDTMEIVKLLANGYSFLASNYLAKGDFNEAMGFYEKTIAIRTDALSKSQQLRNTYDINFWKNGLAGARNNIGIIYWSRGNYTEALQYFKQSLKLYRETGEKGSLVASIISNIGAIYHSQSNYNLALKYYFAALKIRNRINDKHGIANSCNNIGNVYWSQGMLPHALEYIFMGLKVAEEINDLPTIASCYGNIGLILSQQNSPVEALNHFLRCLQIQETIGDKHGSAGTINNIGNIYWDLDSIELALQYYLKTLNLSTELLDSFGIAQAFNNLGSVYTAKNEFSSGIEYQLKALDIYRRIGDKKGMTYALNDLAELFINKGEPLRAVPYVNHGLSICLESGLIAERVNSYYLLFLTDSATGNASGALANYKQYIQWKDSLINEENTRKISRLESKFEWDKKETIIRSEHEKQRAVAAAENRRQKVIIVFIIACLLFVIIISLLVYRNFRRTKKVNVIITKQKEQIEMQKQDIMDSIEYASYIQNAMLPADEEFRNLFPESFILYKPRDIVSGDFYWVASPPSYPPVGGKGITLSPTGEVGMVASLPPTGEAWMVASPPPTGEAGRGAVLLCTADCTGHGVPGAFMSMLCTTLLNEAVNDKRITEPDKIFEEVRKGIIAALKQHTGQTASSGPTGKVLTGDGLPSIVSTKDGMDATIILLEHRNVETMPSLTGGKHASSLRTPNATFLRTVCANNPVYIISNDIINEIKPDRFPVGIYESAMKQFTLHEVELHKGAMIYTITDGFEDQLGSPPSAKGACMSGRQGSASGGQSSIRGEEKTPFYGKKFKSKRLKELLVSIASKPVEEQKEILEKTFEDWKGRGEQTDDVTVIGIRV